MEQSTTIGKNLAFLRELNNMTQEKVAEYLGIKRETISYYENGSRNTPLDILNNLSDLYQVQLIDILEMKEEDRKAKTAMAFRAEGLSSEGYKAIGEFGKIVKNYLKMKRIEERK
ncbi:MAG: helix-turn-helix transcriptional regulator [Ignavibacteriota bacterium]